MSWIGGRETGRKDVSLPDFVFAYCERAKPTSYGITFESSGDVN